MLFRRMVNEPACPWKVLTYCAVPTVGDGSAVARTKSSVTVPESVIAPVAVKMHDAGVGQSRSV